MRRLLVFFLILLAIVVAGDFVLRGWVEARAEGHLQDELDLPQRPDVSIGGWPFVFMVLDGRFPDVHVETGPVTARGVTLQDVHLDLRDVEVATGQAVGGRPGSVRTGGGRGEAYVGADDLREGFREQGVDAEIRLEDDGLLVAAPELPREVEADVRLRGSRLIVAAPGAPVRYEVRLPSPVERMEYRSFVIREGRGVLRFDLAPGRLRAPE